MVQADFRDEALEAHPVLRTRAGLAEVVVDHQDPPLRPAQGPRAGRQAVLQVRGLRVVQDLLGGGLPDVDDGQPFEVRGPDLLRARRPDLRGVQDHGCLLPSATSPRTPRAGAPAVGSGSPAGGGGWTAAAPATAGAPGRLRTGRNRSFGHLGPSSPSDRRAASSFSTRSTSPSSPSSPTIGQSVVTGAL